MVFKKGHKTQALRLFGILLGVMTAIGITAYFISFSTEQTNKVSFKAAGLKYKEQYKVAEAITRSDVFIEENQRKNISLSTSMRNRKTQNSTNENSSIAKAKKVKNSKLTSVERQSEARESLQISLDLRMLSSFDCVKSIPTVLIEYMSTMFINEYGRSQKDFHSQYRMEETLPLLKQFNINCGIDQNCSTLFQYDKQYGLNTAADNTYQRKEVFYCCPSIHSSTNETISNVCKRAQLVAGKSIFRESKDSKFLELVIELVV